MESRRLWLSHISDLKHGSQVATPCQAPGEREREREREAGRQAGRQADTHARTHARTHTRFICIFFLSVAARTIV